MDVLILSDSHGHRDEIREILARSRPEAILFAGDGLRDIAYLQDELPCPLYAVRGNCDTMPPPLHCVNRSATGEVEEESLLEIDGIRILLMHGHRYGVKSGYIPAARRAAALGADVLVFGHTHRPLETCLRPDGDNDAGIGSALTKPLWIFNPGSVGDRPHTFGTMTIRDHRILFGHGSI